MGRLFESLCAPEEIMALARNWWLPDAQVRDWATMMLGSREENDSQEMRDAFVERLEDLRADTAAETAWHCRNGTT